MSYIKDIETLYRFINYNLIDELEKGLELTDLEAVGGSLLEDDTADTTILHQYIAILNFIENETDFVTPVSDDTYDKIVERYKDMGGVREIGVINESSGESSSKKFRQHKYPELRGSLNKVHFIKDSEIPEKDSRKSLEHFLSTTIKELEGQLSLDDINYVPIGVDFKWDGVSHVFEMKNGLTIDHVLTRYDVENNLGMDISHVFKWCDLTKLFLTPLPDNIAEAGEFGLKVETFMPTEFFNRYVTDTGDTRCNRRSAIVSIVNQDKAAFDPSLLQYLMVKPLQISATNQIEIVDGDDGWYYVGKLNDRYQYIHIYTQNLIFEVNTLKDFLYNMDNYPVLDSIEAVKTIADGAIPIDGAVVTILDRDIIAALGRSDNKNRFQIAFKFPQGEKKTILKDVEFPVGPTASTITPLAILEPVVINGNTITNASLSNFDKLNRLDLNIGDEVVVKYDIIPQIFKDNTCKKGTGEKISAPTVCPICHSDLHGGNRCMNPDCDAKLSGKIYNYAKKLRIKNLGRKTVEKLTECGFLTCIGDLYRLPNHQKEIENLKGFGPISFINIMSGIFCRTKMLPHQFLGAIGIPDISSGIMKKVCKEIDIIHMSRYQLEECAPQLVKIRGIGEVTAHKIVKGILDKLDDIEDIIHYLEFDEYAAEDDSPIAVVLFTECRDYEFTEYLESVNVEVANSFTNSVTCLIVPDDMDIEKSDNRKVKRARESGLLILSITKAKETFNYK